MTAPSAALDPIAFLRGLPPFDLLGPRGMRRVEQGLEIAYFPRGSVILRRGGEPSRHLCVVRKGAVRLEREGGTAQLIEEGECFGFPSLIGRASPHVDVVAAEDSPPWDSAVYWALDLETSGLETERDEILSIGMVPVRGGVIQYGEHLYRLVRPRDLAGLSAEGVRAHHILPAELAAAAPLEEALPEIDVRLREGVLVLHQAAVDLGFLRRAFRRAGLGWPRPKVIDTVRLVVKWEHRRQRFEPHPKPFSASLPGARAALGLPAYPHHHALWDALATAELMLALRERLGARRVRELM